MEKNLTLAVALFRLSHYFLDKGPLGAAASKLFWRLNVLLTACDIHPKAKIGAGLRLPRPFGVVIGVGAVIGDNVTIGQRVTLGLRNPDKDDMERDFPQVGNNVSIGSGAVLLGKITIGDGALIGENAVVLHNMLPDFRTEYVELRLEPVAAAV